MGEVEYHIVDNVIYTSNLDDNQNSKGLGHNYYSDMMKYKNNTAQIDGITKEEDTFGSLLQRSVRTALAMIDRGIKPGDHISMCTNNHLNSAVPFIASYFTGSVMGAIEPAMSVRDAIYLLQQTLPKIIFAVPSAVPMVEEIAENIGGDPMIVVFGETSRHTPFSQFILPHENEDKFKPYEPDSLDTTSLIVFSSGTSGMPKGICLSQSNMLSFSEEVTMDFGNVLYSIANPYWSVFPVFLHVSVVYGGARVVYPSFNVNEPWTLFYQYVDVAFLNSVQALQMTRIKLPDNADLKNVKLLYVGGSPLTLNQINEIQSVLPHTMVTNSYSQSELFKHCFDVIPFESELLKNNKLSVGTIQKGVSYKVADVDSGTALGPNQIGELRVKSKSQFVGYLNKDSSERFDCDGFLRTGDLFYYNEKLCFYVVGRIGESFKYYNLHISPAEIEKVILELEQIEAVVVIGLPHETECNHPLAVVKLKPNAREISAEEIVKHVQKNLENHKWLRGGVKFVESFKIVSCVIKSKIPR